MSAKMPVVCGKNAANPCTGGAGAVQSKAATKKQMLTVVVVECWLQKL